jgi:cytidylate kinase
MGARVLPSTQALDSSHQAIDIVLSGRSCVGKTTLARLLAASGWTLVTAREAIAANATGNELDRSQLVALGAELEAKRPGRWLIEVAAAAARPIVLDAVRTQSQMAEARREFSGCLHVHLRASRSARRERFCNRTDWIDQGVSFETIADIATCGSPASCLT